MMVLVTTGLSPQTRLLPSRLPLAAQTLRDSALPIRLQSYPSLQQHQGCHMVAKAPRPLKERQLHVNQVTPPMPFVAHGHRLPDLRASPKGLLLFSHAGFTVHSLSLQA